MNNEIIFIINNLRASQNNGVVISVLRKIKLLEETYGGGIILMITDYNPEFKRICDILRDNGAISKSVRMFGVYDYILGDGYNPANAKRAVGANHPDHYIYDEYLTPEQKLRMKVEYIFDETCIFYNRGNLLKQITVYGGDGSVCFTCADNMGLAAYCLERITDNPGTSYLVVEEGDMYSFSLKYLEKPNVIRACVVHSVFLENPYDLTSQPQFYYKGLCANHAAYDGIIFLTERERMDFIKKYGNINNTFTIPHPYPYAIHKIEHSKRDCRKAVIIARFTGPKRIDLAIDIFGLVVNQVPDARLEIYGFNINNNAQKYKEQIKELRLENNVFIMGYTPDPASIFRGAALSMMTSVVEGYPLTTIESICSGCPVFAYDIKYGPSEIIIDGVTGFLFNRMDNEAYAGKMVEYFNDTALQKRMSESAYHDARRFSKDIFLRKWHNMTETLAKRRLGAGQP